MEETRLLLFFRLDSSQSSSQASRIGQRESFIDDFVPRKLATRGKIKLDPFLRALRYPFEPVPRLYIRRQESTFRRSDESLPPRIAHIEPQMTRKTARKAS